MKTCNHEGCIWPRFGGGYCRSHQQFRTNKKETTSKQVSSPDSVQKGVRRGYVSSGKGLGKTRSRIRTCATKAARKKRQKKSLLKSDFAFYQEIWEERPHICYACECYLGETFSHWFCDHILEKGLERYAHLRHVKENICLLCVDCHTSKNKIKKLILLREETIKKLIP